MCGTHNANTLLYDEEYMVLRRLVVLKASKTGRLQATLRQRDRHQPKHILFSTFVAHDSVRVEKRQI